MSQEQFSRSLGFDRTVITKAETGERPPSPQVAAAIDEAFPHLDGLFSRLTLLARRANGRYPEYPNKPGAYAAKHSPNSSAWSFGI
jgi:transcriptional regulator with XRE-family HTH domain